MRWSGIARPTWMSGEVTSIPSFTRNGRPSFNFSSRPPAGRTSTALRVRRVTSIGGLDYPGSGALSEKVTPSQAAADPQAQTPCPPGGPLRTGHGVIHRRSPDRGRCQDPATRSVTPADAGEHLRLCREQPHGAVDPARLSGANRRPVRSNLAVAEAFDRRDRGQALLRASRRRRTRHGAGAVRRHLESRHRAGWLDDHSAVRQERLPVEPADGRPQADRGSARLAARAEVVQGQDPDRVPQHGLFRQRRVRRRAGQQDLFPPPRQPDEAGRGGAPRRHPRGPEPVGPGCAPPGGQGAPQPGAQTAVHPGLSDEEPVRQLAGLPDAGSREGRTSRRRRVSQRRTSPTTSRTSSCIRSARGERSGAACA